MNANDTGQDRVDEVDIQTDDHPETSFENSSNRLGVLEAQRVSDDDADMDEYTPLPRFLQEQGAWKRFKWMPYPVRRFIIATAKWSKGPPSPKDHKIEPVFPAAQQAPLALLHRVLPQRKQQSWLLSIWLVLWALVFVAVKRQSISATEIAGWGLPATIDCGSRFWLDDNGCGVDGNDCRPFENSGFAFSCPANCAGHQVLNPYSIGDKEIMYRPLVIGGAPSTTSPELAMRDAVYRGDSFICCSAIHVGIITNARGGCGVVKLVGMHENYTSSERNGIRSISFDSYFPQSYAFESGAECQSQDMRWSLLVVSVIFTTGLSLFCTSPALLFFANFVMIFWTVGMATDPPSTNDTMSLFTEELGRFLPAMFTAWVMYEKMGVKRALDGFIAQMEKTVLWLGACWFGALSNYTLERWIPIQRLTPHDIKQQPGAFVALLVIAALLLVVIVKQVIFLRQEGRLINCLRLHGLFLLAILVCLAIPNATLRIHHYILALLLLPGTSMQTRSSLVYQGLLVGLFLNGIARWGWDPVLQTWYSIRGDARIGSPLPAISEPVISVGAELTSITFEWGARPALKYDGISALVNDVERFRAFFSDADGGSATLPASNFTWTRRLGETINEYFRFAWMQGSSAQDYALAGTWDGHFWKTAATS